MALLFSRAKLTGRPYRWEADFADSGGSIGGGGGGWGGSSDGGAGWGGSGADIASPISDAPAISAPAAASTLDSSIGSPAPNAGMTEAEQISSYSQAREMADAVAGMGSGRIGGYSPSAGSIGQREAFLQGLTQETPAEQIEAARPGPVAAIVNGILGVLGIASGTVPGILGGGRTVAGVFNSSGILVNPNAQASDLGFPGNLGASSSAGLFGGSSAPVVVSSEATGATLAGASFLGRTESGMGDQVSSSPVISYDGSQVNVPSPTRASGLASSSSQAAAAALMQGRYAPPPGQAQAPTNPAPWLVLAGLASFLFMG
jgi:hypothetical protein